MHTCMNEGAVIARLKRVEGQVRGIIKLIENNATCEDILMQISAAKSALHKTGQTILEKHVQHCVRDDIESGDTEKTLEKLSRAIDYFSRMS